MNNVIIRLRIMLARFFDQVDIRNTAWLTSILALIAVGVMISFGNFKLPRVTNMLLVSFIFAIGSVISLVFIIRKEFPFFRNIKGKPAIILGVIGFLMSFPISIAILGRLVIELLQR